MLQFFAQKTPIECDEKAIGCVGEDPTRAIRIRFVAEHDRDDPNGRDHNNGTVQEQIVQVVEIVDAGH